MRLCVAGDSGLLGQAVTGWALETGAEVYGVSPSAFKRGRFWRPGLEKKYYHQEMDLLKDSAGFRAAVEKFRPDCLVNCVALVDLSGCEKEPARASALNVDTAESLARLSAEKKIRFAHISTDQVFDGKKGRYREEDAPAPAHVYGKTKRLAEEKVMKLNPEALVLRTNIVGFRDRAQQPTFAEWLCSALARGEEISLADDFVTSSIHVRRFSALLFQAFKEKLKGLYHFASADGASKYEFGRILAQALALDFSKVKKVSLKDLNLSPPRPADSSLDVRKAEQALKISFPQIQETVRDLAEDFKLREALHA